MTETYEQLRDAASGDAGQAWRSADREEGNLHALYRSLKEDPRYTEEHKAQKAWENYEIAREKIAAGSREKARESLKKQAQTAERLSIPLPDGEELITTDTSKLLAAQNEAARIIRKLERASLASPARGPFRPTPVEVLKEEYARGLEVGGMEGGVICRGVLMAADELGADASAVVDGFRKQRHRKALESAHHAERVAGLIGKQINAEPPFPRLACGISWHGAVPLASSSCRGRSYRVPRLSPNTAAPRKPREAEAKAPMLRTPAPLRHSPLQAIRRAWEAFADATVSFVDEATFRVALASRVLTGRTPQETQKGRG
jgi:hypothetical protein